MQANKTVEINGRRYDAVTGLPVQPPKTVTEKTVSPAVVKKRAAKVASSTVHAAPQRSKTLARRVTKKPSHIVRRPQPGRSMDITPSAKVTKFAPHPVAPAPAPVQRPAAAKVAPTETPDIAHQPHPLTQRVAAKLAKPLAAVHAAPTQTAKQIKDTAIAKALAQPTIKPSRKKRAFHFSRRMTIITAIFGVLIIGAYLTYINMPSLSVGFAASQAGIDAKYPEYKPDGYHLAQPVTFSDGEVTLNFSSNSGTGDYTVIQTRSSWDSSAVLNNVVKKSAGDNYVTTQEQGLTIYSYTNNATWVNGGILYTINSSAPLSGDQIRHIATSL